jgi:hypothetical protein
MTNLDNAKSNRFPINIRSDESQKACLHNETGVSKDMKGTAHDFDLPADQGLADGVLLQSDDGVSKDLKGSAHSVRQGCADRVKTPATSSILTFCLVYIDPIALRCAGM